MDQATMDRARAAHRQNVESIVASICDRLGRGELQYRHSQAGGAIYILRPCGRNEPGRLARDRVEYYIVNGALFIWRNGSGADLLAFTVTADIMRRFLIASGAVPGPISGPDQ